MKASPVWMPIRTEISVASCHCSAASSRCASVAAAAAAIALANTEKVLSPSPLCLRSTPPCASTADAMSASWRASAESMGTGALPERCRVDHVGEQEAQHAGR